MIELKKREKIFAQRIDSERGSLLSDIAVWKEAIPAGSVIRHHVQQFEVLATRILSGPESLYDPERWPDLDPTIFESAIVSLLTGKWIKLRQIVLQRMPGNPYASTLQELDGLAEDAYDRLRLALKEVGKREDLSSSPPLVYVGPLARLLLFYEHAPYLIGTPLGAVNESDEFARDVSRQTIPHEAADAIFEQLHEVLEELRFETGRRLADQKPNRKQRAIHAVILNWLGEIVADMAGTALAGEAFARSAAIILAMPDNLVGSSDGEHPESLIRSSIHDWTLGQISAGSAKKFHSSLNRITSPHLDKRFESLPALISVSLEEVQTELLRLVELTWNTPLKSLDNHSLGEVFTAASGKQISRRSATELFPWGQPIDGEDELFRLIGRIDPVNPLPGPELFISEFCCQVLKIRDCCNGTIM